MSHASNKNRIPLEWILRIAMVFNMFFMLAVQSKLLRGQNLEKPLPYRIKQDCRILMPYGFRPHVFVFNNWIPYCEVDMLTLDEVQKELKLDQITIRAFEKAHEEYRALFVVLIKDRLINANGLTETAKEMFIEKKDAVLDALTEEEKEKLRALDKQIYFRRFGLFEYLKLTVGLQGFYPEKKQTLEAFEKKAWDDAFQNASQYWKETIVKIDELLPQDIRNDFTKSIDYFSSPVCADVTIYFLENNESLEKMSNDTKGEERFKFTVQYQPRYTLTFAGNFVLDMSFTERNFAERLFQFVGYFAACADSPDKNNLALTESQKQQIKQLESEFKLEVKRLKQEFTESGSTDEAKKLYDEQVVAFGEGWQKQLWGNVLFEHQKQGMVDMLNDYFDQAVGPAYLLNEQRLTDDVKTEIRNLLEEFSEELEKLEIETTEAVFRNADQYPEIDIDELSNAERPSFFRPSAALMFLKSGNYGK